MGSALKSSGHQGKRGWELMGKELSKWQKPTNPWAARLIS